VNAKKPEFAPLLDAAMFEAWRAFGLQTRPTRVELYTNAGTQVGYDVPADWTVDPDAPAPGVNAGTAGLKLVRGPMAIVEILVTMYEVGHRLTRAALTEAMEKAGRRRAESMIGESLTQMMQLGLVNNRQDQAIKGYGLIDFEDPVQPAAQVLRLPHVNGNGKAHAAAS
jgi:hypothetical protein